MLPTKSLMFIIAKDIERVLSNVLTKEDILKRFANIEWRLKP